jgi:hypothetical protein
MAPSTPERCPSLWSCSLRYGLLVDEAQRRNEAVYDWRARKIVCLERELEYRLPLVIDNNPPTIRTVVSPDNF